MELEAHGGYATGDHHGPDVTGVRAEVYSFHMPQPIQTPSRHGQQPLTVGFDIGGTHVRAGVVSAEGEIIDQRSADTLRDAQALEAAIARLTDELRADHDIAAVGLAVAGFVDPTCTTVRFAPHLPWRDAPVKHILEEKLGLPVRLEHDANSAAWGEYRFGAGRGAQHWVFYALGTGIGATIMTPGGIYRGAHGTAPEFGHIVAVPGGRACPCGKRGCLERYVSGTALSATAAELRADYSTSLPEDAAGEAITAAAREGDPLALAVMEEFSRWLGHGLSLVADIIDPELIVIGGGLAKESSLYMEPSVRHMEASVVGAGHRPTPRVVSAELGSRAGMIGVADLARDMAVQAAASKN